MNCATHTAVAAVAYCRTCGKPLCAACVRDVRGTMFCEQCLAERVAGALPPTPVPGIGAASTSPSYAGERLPSPGMAAALGFIPGVGAMYNGQFMKGFIHVMAFVCLIWMADHFGPIMIPVFFAYFFYLVFDAYKTAHALELGQPAPDPFGFERMFGTTVHHGSAAAGVGPSGSGGGPVSGFVPEISAGDAPRRSNVPTGAVVLIALGLVFLLHTVGMFEFAIDRFWPIILIGFGVYLFAKRWGLLGTDGITCTCDRCKMRCIMWPAIMVTVGVLFLLDNLHGPGFERTWPLILLVIGAVKLLQSNASDAGHHGGPPVLPPPAGTAPPAVPVESQGQGEPSSEVNHV
jgi:TM2 domain-containing membrane protein YozV